MTDISVTAASVVPGATARTVQGIAGETIVAGKAVYLSSATNKWMLGDSDHATASVRAATGVALTGSSLNQPIVVAKKGSVNMGATLVAGEPYFLSATAGGICPYADLSVGERIIQLGIATSAALLEIDVIDSGVTHAS